MGRPDPCVLFAQTFVHPQLDEYVDEVIFAEPIVITACEFLEQSSSSASSAVTLVGATSPPSFAVEVFVQCEGETRFRRLCQPFLYSHSSSNVLEVEAVVTNHLVVRGSYRSLSLVVYGNTAEDLGQFSLEFDLDHSLANLVSSAEAKDDDLPSLLQERFPKVDDSILSLKSLPLLIPASDLSEDIRKFMQLIFKILDTPDLDELLHVVIAHVSSAAASFFKSGLLPSGMNSEKTSQDRHLNVEEPQHIFIEAGKSLLDHCHKYTEVRCISSDVFSLESIFAQSVVDFATSRELVDMLFLHFKLNGTMQCVRHSQLSQSKTVLFWLSSVLLLCSSRESCFHFVNGGGMRQLDWLFKDGMKYSVAVTLMLLGVAEQATQFSVGCEGLLGWWPRDDAAIPSSYSEVYSHLLKLLMEKQRHDVASLAMNILHHLRLYEVASRYEYSILTVLGGLSGPRSVVNMASEVADIRFQLKKILKLLASPSLPEDPSPLACASRSLILGQTDGVLSYKSTCKLISLASCCFLNWDIDPTLLSLLKERGFLPLSIALLSSSKFRAEVGLYFDAFIDITSSIESITLLLLFCRSGLVFLLHHPELSSTIISVLNVVEDLNKEVGIPLRYVHVLLSKGYFVRSQDVAVNVHIHMRVVKAIDCLVAKDLQSEVLLGVLREFCALARTVCGRQALLTLAYFPEAVTVLIDALQSAKESETVSSHSGIPLNLAIFHSAAEIFEIIVTDPTSSSMASWIDHAPGLYKALHSSSPGSNRKDSPTRLLEWIDAGVVYHRSGALGLLRYAAVLASGADAPLISTNILASDTMDVEMAEVESSSGPDMNVVENLLGKLISEKSFEGFSLRDSSVAQLTTTLRILALISENMDIASVLYDEGANTIIYVILINCRLMLERSFNHYDYLIDEGSESNSTSDLLLERNREKCLVDLLVPTLMLLLELLQKLKEAKEQYRNTKLMNALLHLHRELSPKLAASAADLSSTYPEYALSLETVCHLIASALAYWPTLSWAPGLYHTLLESVHGSALLALGPKEVCSMFCLLNDLLPEEDIRLWKADMPILTTLRSLAVGSVLGPHKERQVNWYLQPVYFDVLISQLIPHLGKIAEVVLHYAVSNLAVIQDLIRVFIIRIACQRSDTASVLLQPIISWILDHIPEPFSPMEIDAYKVHKLIEFLSCLLEHPFGKPLLLKEDGLQMLIKVLQQSIAACQKQLSDAEGSIKSGFSYQCFLPTIKSLTLICDSRSTAKTDGTYDRHGSLSAEDSSLIFRHLFKLWQILPVERELVASLQVFKELVFQSDGRQGLLQTIEHVKSSGFSETQWESEHEITGGTVNFGDDLWNKHPLLCCWIILYKTVEKDGLLNYAIEALHALSLGALKFCFDGKSLNKERVAALKYSFGISEGPGDDSFSSENTKYIEEMPALLGANRDENLANTYVHQVSEFSRSLLLLVQPQTELVTVEDSICKIIPRFSSKAPLSSKIPMIRNGSLGKTDVDSYFREMLEKFQWECPENLRSRLSQGPLGKRKLASSDGPNRLGRGENSPSEAQSPFSRGSVPSTVPSVPTRRDSFRQRKPNTSRPPSMHVDDYVARERNGDGSSNSNVIAIPRIGSSSGRPPSVHVDEFMARQRERHNTVPVPMAGAEASGAQGKPIHAGSEDGAKTSNKPKTLKVDLDDDLQGIDIVFDGEELEPDDKLPFPQADDIVQKDESGTGEQSPPRSIVEETDSDVNNIGATVAPHVDENSQNELSSRVSVSRREMSLTREPSITSVRKYPDQCDEKRSPVVGMTIDAPSASPIQVQGDSRRPPHNFYPQNMQQIGNVTVIKPGGMQRDPKFMPSQPPLPPTPPPPSISPVRSHGPDSHSSPFRGSMSDAQPLAPSYHVPSEYQGGYSNMTPHLKVDSRYPWQSHSSPVGPSRHLPPLPPNPPPFQASQFSMPLRTSSSSQLPFNSQTGIPSSEMPSFAYGSDATRSGNLQNSGSRLPYHQPMPSGMLNRPTSMQPYDNLPSISPSMATSQLPFQPGLQPLQPPQVPFQPQIPQHLRSATGQGFQQGDQGGGLQGPGQLPSQPQQVVQQSPPYYQQQPQQQDTYSGRPLIQQQQAQAQPYHQQLDGESQEALDSSMSLQQYFSSPEAIQSLLSDRDKLCQLLEQHPKLMQMLQERLGHL